MKDFDSLLAEAAARYAESAVPEEEHDYSEAARKRLSGILGEERKEKTMTTRRISKSMKAVLIAAAVLLTTVIVCAATPAIRNYLNLTFLQNDSAGPLTEVPEGWIGVYTAEDLDNVRNDVQGKYILMNDIVLTEADYAEGGLFEGGFTPIGDGTRPFYGTFNGNGHVISGLYVTNSRMGDWSRALYGGLFGCARRYYSQDVEADYEVCDWDVNGDSVIDENDRIHVGVEIRNCAVTGGLIKNLGLTDGAVLVTYGEETLTDLNGDGEYEYPGQFAVGAVAGWADYVVGCWTENFTVSFEAEETISSSDSSDKWVAVGGVVGGCSMMDSCWSNADVTVNAEAENPELVYAAGLAGMADSCVTSYYDGSVDGGAVNLREVTVPIVLTESVLEDIAARLDETDSEGEWGELADGTQHSWNARKFMSFYCTSDAMTYDFSAQDFTTGDSEEAIYLLDPETKPREYQVLANLIAQAFPDGDFREYCIESGIKFDTYYTYDLRTEPDCAFEGFDFDSIWTWNEENRPVLRLFEADR